MKQFIRFSLLLAIVVMAANTNVQAQSKQKGQEVNQQDDVLSFGTMESVSEFPTPPGKDAATAVVNFNIDAMGLNTGENEIHYDEATNVKLFAYYNPMVKKYTLYAKVDGEREIPVEVEIAEDNPTCIFAYIGPDWINVLCSERYIYGEKDEVIEKKEEEKKPVRYRQF